MPRVFLFKAFLFTALIAGGIFFLQKQFADPEVDYSSEIKPLLNRKCISCHGGVKKQGGFSLLFREEALAKTKSGKYAIVPGDPQNSEMIRRLTLDDPEERMPYQHPPLNAEEISLLKRWIAQGAKWGEHWAYQPLRPVAVPSAPRRLFGLLPAMKDEWALNDIDLFIKEKLRSTKLKPSAAASKAVLLRRVSLDLTGLPPTNTMADRFFADTTGNAYPQLVDSLLASPHFGERWTSMWLDLARYADTKGYERDDSRSIWRYRDWLIQSFNNDKPYDAFVREQIAGDMFPGATDDDLVATAFHRNTMTNDEGGTDNEEFRTAAVLDRVNTTWEGLLGTSFACVQCHSHPYDPFRHEDYYRFMAYFNNTRDEDTYDDYPVLRHFNDTLSARMDSLMRWLNRNAPLQKDMIKQFLKTWQPAHNSLTAQGFSNSELADTKFLVLRNHGSAFIPGVDLHNKEELVMRYFSGFDHGTLELHADSAKGPLLTNLQVSKTKGWTFIRLPLTKSEKTTNVYLTYKNPTITKATDNGIQFDWLAFNEAFPGMDLEGYAWANRTYWELLRVAVPVTPVMQENPKLMHRRSQVFEKGNWLVKGDEVQPGVPAVFAAALPSSAPRDRRGLAEWLTSSSNPLLARTIVNRLWEQLFGAGIVETLEDMGSQGATPTHRELLDYLSYQLMHEYKWSLKKLLKEIVLSATYRQDSRVTPEGMKVDPENRLLSRAPRVRLSAEQLRDQALRASGTLNEQMFGPSVFPYQPPGIWLSPWNGAEWHRNVDSQQYRRAVYTYWKRTAPYPAMITYDGVAREVCTARRIRTNTPLQALASLNDSAFVDMAKHLATRMVSHSQELESQLNYGYTCLLFRPASKTTIDALKNLYMQALTSFHSAANTAMFAGSKDESEARNLAAMTVVANALLNLDEVITKN